MVSAFPVWPSPTALSEEDAIAALGLRLLSEFVTSSRAAGIVPLVVYFPSRGDFSGQDRGLKDRVIAASSDDGFEIHNLTECVRDIGEGAFVAGGAHYSGEGNAAVAECILTLINAALGAQFE
jgi:hypothetical protein